MSCLAWNYRGLGNPHTVRALKKLIFDKDPSCVFLLETRKKDFEMNKFRNINGLSGMVVVSCLGDGKKGSVVLLCYGKRVLMWRYYLSLIIILMF